MERSGACLSGRAGTSKAGWSVNYTVGVVAGIPRPQTVPRVMHPPHPVASRSGEAGIRHGSEVDMPAFGNLSEA